MAATHVFVELSRAIACYNIYITLVQVPSQLRVRLTPTPECLYVQVTEELILVIPLAAPVTDTSNVSIEMRESLLCIRLPCSVDISSNSVLVPQLSLPMRMLRCSHCDAPVATDLEQAYELPELEWEELSELWNCHPSHHQTNPLVLEANRCFMDKLAVVLHPQNTLGLQVSGETPETTVAAYEEVQCQGCGCVLGEAKIVCVSQVNGKAKQFSLQLHRVHGPDLSWTFLALIVRQLVLLPDFDYKRTLAISASGNSKSLLLSVSAKNALILRNGKYQEAAKCLYEVTEAKDFRTCRVPTEDFKLLQSELKARNRYLPTALRRIGPKRLAYLVYAEIFPAC